MTYLENYYKDRDEFMKSVDVTEIEMINKMRQIMDDVHKGANGRGGFMSWTGNQLINYQFEMSRYLEPLNTILAEWVGKGNYVYVHKKMNYAKQFSPLKKRLKDEMDKVTNVDVESKLAQTFELEEKFIVLAQMRADKLKGLIDSMNSVLKVINSRLIELHQEEKLNQSESFGLKGGYAQNINKNQGK